MSTISLNKLLSVTIQSIQYLMGKNTERNSRGSRILFHNWRKVYNVKLVAEVDILRKEVRDIHQRHSRRNDLFISGLLEMSREISLHAVERLSEAISFDITSQDTVTDHRLPQKGTANDSRKPFLLWNLCIVVNALNSSDWNNGERIWRCHKKEERTSKEKPQPKHNYYLSSERISESSSIICIGSYLALGD